MITSPIRNSAKPRRRTARLLLARPCGTRPKRPTANSAPRWAQVTSVSLTKTTWTKTLPPSWTPRSKARDQKTSQKQEGGAKWVVLQEVGQAARPIRRISGTQGVTMQAWKGKMAMRTATRTTIWTKMSGRDASKRRSSRANAARLMRSSGASRLMWMQLSTSSSR